VFIDNLQMVDTAVMVVSVALWGVTRAQWMMDPTQHYMGGRPAGG
jgi:hypothetical protein